MTQEDIKNKIREKLSIYDKNTLVNILVEYLFISSSFNRVNILSNTQQCLVNMYSSSKMNGAINKIIKDL